MYEKCVEYFYAQHEMNKANLVKNVSDHGKVMQNQVNFRGTFLPKPFSESMIL